MQNLRDLELKVRRLDPRDVKRASADIVDSVGSALEDIEIGFAMVLGIRREKPGALASEPVLRVVTLMNS